MVLAEALVPAEIVAQVEVVVVLPMVQCQGALHLSDYKQFLLRFVFSSLSLSRAFNILV